MKKITLFFAGLLYIMLASHGASLRLVPSFVGSKIGVYGHTRGLASPSSPPLAVRFVRQQ